jgi:hypothetical protein
MPIIPALGKLRQENQKLKGTLGYKKRPCLKKKKEEEVEREREREKKGFSSL